MTSMEELWNIRGRVSDGNPVKSSSLACRYHPAHAGVSGPSHQFVLFRGSELRRPVRDDDRASRVDGGGAGAVPADGLRLPGDGARRAGVRGPRVRRLGTARGADRQGQ